MTEYGPPGVALTREYRDKMLADARTFVATTPESGLSQLALLQSLGLRPSDHVLEYGAGSFHLAIPLIEYLDPLCYCAVEPELWLMQAALGEDIKLARLWMAKVGRWAVRDDFNAADEEFGGTTFEYIYAHSVLSHAAGYQLPQMLAAAVAVLAPGGQIVVSYREGPDTNAPEWTYPEPTFFSRETIVAAATAHGLAATFRPDLRERHVANVPDEIHDWAVFDRA